jgi:hypothetical protein
MKRPKEIMKEMKSENKLDEFFRKGLVEPDLPFNEVHWENMEKKLALEKPKRILPLWLLSVTGVAASLILLFFILFKAEKITSVKPGKNLQAKTAETAPKPREILPENHVGNNNYQRLPNHSSLNLIKAEATDSITIPNRQLIDPGNSTNYISVLVIDTLKVPMQSLAIERPKPAEEKVKINQNNGNRFSFSLIAAPDISSSPSNLSAKVSTNLGLLATYAFTKKLSFSTGVIYAKKLYNYSGTFTTSYGSPAQNWETDANCKVLDIPINLNYLVFKKGQNAITLNTGVSSYFMLNEKYKYITKNALGSTEISQLEVVNQNQHLFGVANLGVSFNRKIDKRLNIGVQPFIKIPMTGIGLHDSKLRSAGVAFSININ